MTTVVMALQFDFMDGVTTPATASTLVEQKSANSSIFVDHVTTPPTTGIGCFEEKIRTKCIWRELSPRVLRPNGISCTISINADDS